MGSYQRTQGSGGPIELRADRSFEEGLSITPTIFVDETGKEIGRGDGWNPGKKGEWRVVESGTLSLTSNGFVEHFEIEDEADSIRLISNRDGVPTIYEKVK